MLNKRFSIIAVVVVVFVLLLSVTVQAQELRGTIDRRGGINLLGGAGNQFYVMAGVPDNYVTRALGRNADSSWVEVVTPNGRWTGWVPERYIELDGNIEDLPVTALTGKWSATVGTGALNIRAEDNDDSEILFTLNSGDNVDMHARNAAGSWVYITVPDSTIEGWISTRYIYNGVKIQSLPVWE